MSNKTIDEVLAVMCNDTTFSQATTKEEWQQENETQPFAMFAREEGSEAENFSKLRRIGSMSAGRAAGRGEI